MYFYSINDFYGTQDNLKSLNHFKYYKIDFYTNTAYTNRKIYVWNYTILDLNDLHWHQNS